MNQRIQELAKAYLVHERYTRYGEIVEEDLYEFYPDELEKFAELIVRECIEQLNISNVPASISAGLNLGRVAIKEHFGVEE